MKVISLINMKGGVGKTTLATNICDCLSRREKSKVLLIDIDPQFNATQCVFSGDDYMKHLEEDKDTVIKIFDEPIRHTASTVKGVSATNNKDLKDIIPVEIKNNFYILPGNLDLYRIEMSSGSGKENRLKKYIKAIQEKEKFDYVIIDTPPTPSIWMTSALIASDYYLIPVKPDPISFTGIDLLKNIIENKRENFDLSIKCIGLVFSMVERHDSLNYRGAKYTIENSSWEKYKFEKYLPKRTSLARSQLDQVYILDLQESDIKTNLIKIVEELLQRIGKDEKNGHK